MPAPSAPPPHVAENPVSSQLDANGVAFNAISPANRRTGFPSHNKKAVPGEGTARQNERDGARTRNHRIDSPVL
jgi:hypothetical protein